MVDLTDKYGEFIALYNGQGIVNEVECDFEVGQLLDGTIIIQCRTDSIRSKSETNHLELKGLTTDGKKISVEGNAISEHSSSQYARGQATLYHSEYRSAGAISLKVNEYEWNNVSNVSFAITNFVFWGNKTEQVEDKISLNTLTLNLDGIDCSIRQLDEYKKTIDNLRTQSSVAITCELIIETSNRSLDEIFEFVDSFCSLLSIARGRKINWLYYTLHDIDQSSLFTEHQPRITAPYQGFELIDLQHEETITFLEQCYPTYKSLNPVYHFDKVANIMVDIHSRGSLESRCLALFSVIESLARKVKERGKLKSKIKALKKYHNIPISDAEIDIFVKSRTFLVHELAFSTNNPEDEYITNLHFFHRLILGVLDYKSYYINVTKHPLYTGSRADKLTPTSC